MTDLDFLPAILAAPHDDTPRLIYADWLEEHGDAKRGDFIRIQCELVQIGPERRCYEGTIRGGEEGIYFWPDYGDQNLQPIEEGMRIDVKGRAPASRSAHEESLTGLVAVEYWAGPPHHGRWLLKRDDKSKPYPSERASYLRMTEHALLVECAFAKGWIPYFFCNNDKWARISYQSYVATLMAGRVVERFVYRRGFMHSLTCSGDTWCEHASNLVWLAEVECGECNGSGVRYEGFQVAEIECERCLGKKVIPNPVPPAPTAQPIEEVNLTSLPSFESLPKLVHLMGTGEYAELVERTFAAYWPWIGFYYQGRHFAGMK